MPYIDLCDDKPIISPLYNTDSGVCSWEDHCYRQQLNDNVKTAAKMIAYAFDRGTKPLLRKKLS